MEQKFEMNIVISGSNVRLEIKRGFQDILEQAGYDVSKGKIVTAVFETEDKSIRLNWPKQ